MLNKQEKIERIREIGSENAIHDLLEDLLPEMGFGDVTITHKEGNELEYGKDIICSILNEIEEKKEWIAFVVKKGTVSGKSQKIKEVEAQIEECFEYDYKSLDQRKPISISKVKVVTNKHFSNKAEEKILRNKNLRKPNIDFWHDKKIVKFIDKHYPKYWLKGSKQYKKYVSVLRDRIKKDNVAKQIGLKNKKAEELLENAISLKLIEIKELEDGTLEQIFHDSSSVIKIPDNSLIVGEPGAGKSTLFKTLADEVIEQNKVRNEIEFYPIIISFLDLVSADFSVEKAIEKYFKEEWLSEIAIDYEEIIKNKNYILFVDSLDEIAKQELKEESLKAIKFFKEENPEVKIYCSSRSLSDKASLRFLHYSFAPIC